MVVSAEGGRRKASVVSDDAIECGVDAIVAREHVSHVTSPTTPSVCLLLGGD